MRNLYDLDGKVAVVFGGNGYLGKQFCLALAEYGAETYSCDISVRETDGAENECGACPGKIHPLKVNAADKTELIALRQEIEQREQRIDILVNATTMKANDFYLPFEDVSLEGWDVGLLGNLTIPFLTVQTFVPLMKAHRKGSIINISSHYGIVGNDQRIYEGANLDSVYTHGGAKNARIYSHGVYNAAKGGLINFTRYLAAYYGEYNIRANCISPGGVYHEAENKVFLEKYSSKVPLGRKANRDEINGALIFLASDSSSYVTGHNLVVDGGYTIW